MEEFAPNPWYALHVKTREESGVDRLLKGKGYETFLPLFSVVRTWSDRTRKLSRPLFPGYLFCRLDVNNRLPVLQTPGVFRIVGAGASFTPVDPAEIESVMRVVNSQVPCEPWPFLEIGRKVRVIEGPLRGVEGLLIEIRKQFRLVISVQLLQRSVALELASTAVATVHEGHTSPPKAISQKAG